MKINYLSIRKKIIGIIFLLLFFDIVSYFLIFKNTKTSQKDTVTVDIAGRNRMLSQKMAALSSTALSDDKVIASKSKSELLKTISLFEKSLETLIQGGIPPKTKLNFEIEPAPKEIKGDILRLENYFLRHKKLLETVIHESKYHSSKFQTINPNVKSASHELQERFLDGKMLMYAQRIVDDYTKLNEKKQSIFYLYLSVLFVLNLLIVFVILLYFFKKISNPIEKLNSVSQEISHGNFNMSIDLNQEDEIGLVAKNINRLIENITKASDFAKEIGQNNLSVDFQVLGAKDVLGNSLIAMRDNLKQVADQEAKRNWINEGLAKFTEILRQTDNIEIFYNNVLSNLVRYINANQGYLYVVNDEENDSIMEIKAVYAYGKQRYLEEKQFIHFKQGLVGQAWFDKEPLFFTEIPEDYVNITSGMGEATPRSIFIMPLIVNEIVVGALEFASFSEIEDYVKEFVSKISESIAGAVQNVKTNERTRMLLELSQQQTEEMRAQEEEMRQNMEEMQATQAEMTRKEREMNKLVHAMQQQEEELRQNMEEMKATQEEMEKQAIVIREQAAEQKGILDGINATMAVIEFTPDGYVKDANENFFASMKVTLSDIVGKHHSNFVPEDIKATAEYKRFWSDLAIGIEKKDVVKRVNGLGETVWLNAIYNPIKDASGKVVKVIKFATDITTQKEQEAQVKAQTDIINDIAIVSKTDLQGNITYVNDEFLKWSKYTKEEVMGKNHRILKSGDQDDQIFVDMWKTISSGKIFRGEIKNKAKDGSFYWVDAIIAPILDENGKPKEYLAQRFVINEQKEKEQENSAQKRILDQVCIISKTDLKGNITYVNEEFLKWSKYSENEVIGKNHRILKSGDQDDQIFVDMWQTISSGKVFRGEIKNKAKDGSFYWVDAIVAPVLDDKGKPVEYMAQRFVINEQKEKEFQMQQVLEETRSQEEEIRQNLEEMAATQEEMERQSAIIAEKAAEAESVLSGINATMAVIEFDTKGNILTANENFTNAVGYKLEDIKGKHHQLFVSDEYKNSKEYAHFWTDLAAGRPNQGIFERVDSKGNIVKLNAIYNPIKNADGQVVKIIKFATVIHS